MTAHLTQPVRLDMSPGRTQIRTVIRFRPDSRGVSIVGPVHRDADLLRLARQLSETHLQQRKMAHA